MKTAERSKYIKILFDSTEVIPADYAYAAKMMLEELENIEPAVFSHLNLYNDHLLKGKDRINGRFFFFLEGIGMKLLLFLKSGKLFKDINGTDLFGILAPELKKKDTGIFLLGSDKAQIERAAKVCRNRYELNISGYHHGYFEESSEPEIVELINKSGASLLISGMGMVKEWDFLLRNYNKLKVNIIWNVGALFSYVSGAKMRAPKLIIKLRLEWLHRFFAEPIKKAYRIFIVPFTQLYRYFVKVEIKINHEADIYS